jgi:hypothetical protein
MNIDKEFYYFSGELEDLEEIQRAIESTESINDLISPDREKVLDFCEDLCYPNISILGDKQ